MKRKRTMVDKFGTLNNYIKTALICFMCFILTLTILYLKFYANYSQRKLEERQCIEVVTQKASERMENVYYTEVLKYDARTNTYMVLVANKQDTHAIVYKVRYYEKKEDCVPIIFIEHIGSNSKQSIFDGGK